jgi:hypothetical protein
MIEWMGAGFGLVIGVALAFVCIRFWRAIAWTLLVLIVAGVGVTVMAIKSHNDFLPRCDSTDIRTGDLSRCPRRVPLDAGSPGGS